MCENTKHKKKEKKLRIINLTTEKFQNLLVYDMTGIILLKITAV